MRTCSIDGCGRLHEAKGFCNGHYSRFRKHGDAMRGGVLIQRFDVEARFWAKVPNRPEIGCWEWTGSRGWFGHGVFRDGTKQIGAHRFAYELANGPIPPGACVLHRCGEGIDHPWCVRASHLYVGDRADNAKDRDQTGTTARGLTNGKSKLTGSQVRAIRSAYATGKYTQRQLAATYGVSHPTVGTLVRGSSYQDV